mgnify:CR=1 FL=1
MTSMQYATESILSATADHWGLRSAQRPCAQLPVDAAERAASHAALAGAEDPRRQPAGPD